MPTPASILPSTPLGIRPFNPCRATCNRAFALPLVLLLTLVVGMGLVVLLQRHATTHLATVRQARGYASAHQAAGLKEVINRWMPTVRGRIHESLAEGGLAFRLDMTKAGNTIDIYFEDGQGTLLDNANQLSGRKREILEDMIDLIHSHAAELERFQEPEGTSVFRSVGPPEISLHSAPPIIIHALTLAVIGEPGKASAAATALLARVRRERDRGTTSGIPGAAGAGTTTLPQGEVVRALQELNLDQVLIKEIESMLIEKNTLWKIVAESKDSSGKVYDRSGGLYEAVETRLESFNQNAGFLQWDQLPLE